jgi:hypothetical protein
MVQFNEWCAGAETQLGAHRFYVLTGDSLRRTLESPPLPPWFQATIRPRNT